ncbi:MAG: DUF3348 family protein [Acidobacteriota bacterium]
MHLRRNVSSSRLVQLLGGWAAVSADDSRQDFAQRLGTWLSAVDTVRLDAAMHSIQTLAAHKVMGDHAALSTSLAALEAGLQGLKASAPKGMAVPPPDSDYAGYYQRYQAQQRDIEAKVASLRTQARQALSAASTRLRQLAALDAVLEQMLGAREQKLLATVPVFLERRFEHWRQSEQGDWAGAFIKDCQAMLLAEADVRLEPVKGLIEALGNEVRTHQ